MVTVIVIIFALGIKLLSNLVQCGSGFEVKSHDTPCGIGGHWCTARLLFLLFDHLAMPCI